MLLHEEEGRPLEVDEPGLVLRQGLVHALSLLRPRPRVERVERVPPDLGQPVVSLQRATRFGERLVRCSITRTAVRVCSRSSSAARQGSLDAEHRPAESRCGTAERGTTLVPTATSYASRMSTRVDDLDALDASGRIDTHCDSAGGRKVAGSNPAAPTRRKPASEAGFYVAELAWSGRDGRRGTGRGTRTASTPRST